MNIQLQDVLIMPIMTTVSDYHVSYPKRKKQREMCLVTDDIKTKKYVENYDTQRLGN